MPLPLILVGVGIVASTVAVGAAVTTRGGRKGAAAGAAAGGLAGSAIPGVGTAAGAAIGAVGGAVAGAIADDSDESEDDDEPHNQGEPESRRSRKSHRSNSRLLGEEVAGIGAGVTASGANIASDIPKFSIPKTGHGFAAEQANDLFDKFSGKSARIVGGDNAKYGADRLVDGAYIQTKYYNSAKKTVQAFLDSKGNWKYRNPDGSIMPGEVPYDQYPAALKYAKDIPGVSDPKGVIRRGSATYTQARNIARFGTVDALKYDAANGAVFAVQAMGISAAVSFAVSIWHGEDAEAALKRACETGIRVGGVIWASHILAAQLGRAGSLAANALRSGGSIHGAAAAKHISKLSRGNLATGIAVTAVLSSVDFARMFQGRMSGAQLFKNVSTTASGVAGGTGGWMAGTAAGAAAGAAIGTLIAPGVGTVIGTKVGFWVGGLSGATAGGYAASKAAEAVLDEFIEDDAKQMLAIMKNVFEKLCVDYLLNEEEAQAVLEDVQGLDLPVVLRDMYESGNRNAHARRILKPIVENQVRERKRIVLPSNEDMARQTGQILRQASEAGD